MHDRAVVELGTEPHHAERRRQHAPDDIKHAARLFNGAIEVAGHAAHCRQEEIPEGVPAQAFTFGESEAEEIGNQCFVVGERDQTVADVAGRQNAEFLLQAA